jgi:hypothetical protein
VAELNRDLYPDGETELTPVEPHEVLLARGYLPEFELLGDHELRHAPEPEDLEAIALDAISPWPLARSCSTEYRARRSSGRRPLSAITLGVVHCTQGFTALGAASWFANPASQGSAHDVADALRCYRTLPPSLIPWGAPGVNGRGWHLEIAGFAQWTRAEWLARRGLLNRAAYKLAQNGRGRFPMKRLSRAELRAGHVRGVIDHKQATDVYGGSHTDVGPGFPWDVFMTLARRYEKELAR